MDNVPDQSPNTHYDIILGKLVYPVRHGQVSFSDLARAGVLGHVVESGGGDLFDGLARPVYDDVGFLVGIGAASRREALREAVGD